MERESKRGRGEICIYCVFHLLQAQGQKLYMLFYVTILIKLKERHIVPILDIGVLQRELWKWT